jgi:type II secretory pathway pseudopilin PulG
MKETFWKAARIKIPERPRGSVLHILVLVALLVVIAAIAMGSVRYARNASARNHATLVMSNLREAFLNFKTKYTRLPITLPDETTVQETKGTFLAALVAVDPVSNPENISFLNQPAVLKPTEHVSRNAQGEWELRDPWGNLYRLQLDLNEDGKFPRPAGNDGPAEAAIIPPGLVIYSAGPDGKFETWQDNLRNWE